MSKSAVQRGLKGLREKQVIVAERRRTREHGDVATSYRVRMAGDPVGEVDLDPWSASGSGGGSPATSPVVHQRTTQETEEQQTVRQFEFSKNLDIKIEELTTIGRYIEDLARELRDEAPLSSSTTRASRIYVDSGLTLDTFIEQMLEARRKTQERSAGITKQSKGGRGEKSKMSYWFAVLEDATSLARRSG